MSPVTEMADVERRVSCPINLKFIMELIIMLIIGNSGT
jgi:hypothetical protein